MRSCDGYMVLEIKRGLSIENSRDLWLLLWRRIFLMRERETSR